MRDSPAARMKSKAPNEMPFSACRNASSGLIGPWRLFPWILHAGDLVADHVDRLPAYDLHLTEVHVLDRLRLELRDERQEVVVAERRLQGAGHFAAALREAGGEVGLRLRPEPVVRDEGEGLLHALLRRHVLADRVADLP